MKFEGTVEIAAPRDRVWAFVIDPEQVGQCGPGVESIEVIDDTHFKATAKVGIGFISARFVVNMEMAEQQPPDRAVIKAHGQAPGSAVDATASMALSDGDAGGTRMDWNADVAISGSLASLGARLIEGTANKMIGQTFDVHEGEAGGLTTRAAPPRSRSERPTRDDAGSGLGDLADAVPHLVWVAAEDGTGPAPTTAGSPTTVAARGGRRRQPGSWELLVHPDDLAATTAAWEAAVRTGRPYEHEHRLRMADGD